MLRRLRIFHYRITTFWLTATYPAPQHLRKYVARNISPSRQTASCADPVESVEDRALNGNADIGITIYMPTFFNADTAAQAIDFPDRVGELVGIKKLTESRETPAICHLGDRHLR